MMPGDGSMLMEGPNGPESNEGLVLELQNSTAGNVRLILHGTVPDTVYSIYSKINLGTGLWTFEKDVVGAADQDWTDILIAMNGRQTLFFRAGTADDTDGDGLSDAEEMFITGTDPANPDTGNTGIPDGYKDLDGDQWTNLDEIRNGTNPNGWDAPPAPHGLIVTQVPANSSATLTWDAAPGPVQYYIVQKNNDDQFTVPASQTSFVDTLANFDPPPFYGDFDRYYVSAVYASGPSMWTAGVSLADPSKSLDGSTIIRGSHGKLYLVCSQIPQSVTTIHVHRTVYESGFDPFIYLHCAYGYYPVYDPPVQDGYFDIPVTENASVVEIPASEAPPYVYYNFEIQGRAADGTRGRWFQMPPFSDDNSFYFDVSIPFLDGRRHLKENLIFQMRAARGGQAFGFNLDWEPYRYDASPDTIVSGFHVFLPYYSTHFLNEFSPFEVNAYHSNFVFNVNELEPSGYLDTGAWYSRGGQTLAVETPKYWFDKLAFINSPDRTLPTALSYPDSRWILLYGRNFDSDDTDYSTLGLNKTTVSGPPIRYRYPSTYGYANVYGLPFQ